MEINLHLPENFRATAQVRQHSIFIDEPLSVGGEDTAPTPTELVAAALAGCTAITLKMYIQHKGFSVKNVAVNVKTEQDEKNRITKFIRYISVEELSADAPKDRLLKVAEACPVHKLLAAGTPIETYWAD